MATYTSASLPTVNKQDVNKYVLEPLFMGQEYMNYMDVMPNVSGTIVIDKFKAIGGITSGFTTSPFSGESGEIGETDNFHPASSNDVIDLGAVEQGWLTGGFIRLTGVNTTTWFVEAFLMGDGTLATPFTDS